MRDRIRYRMVPGPVEMSPRTIRAMSMPTIDHRSPEFVALFEETTEKLQQILQTKSDIIIMQGECVLGLEAALASILNPGDRVLVLDSGPYGRGFGQWVSMYGAEPVYVSVEWNDTIDPSDVEKRLVENDDFKVLSVVHSETPAGTVNPVGDICKVAKKHGVLTIVDAVSSVGGIDVRPDDWGIDICITGSEKCLSAPPLTVISISETGWQAIEEKKRPLRNSYLSILDWKETWIRNRTFPHIPLVSDIRGLSESASEIIEEGLPNVFKRHRTVASAIRAGLKGIGVKLWPKNEKTCSDTVTAVAIPDGIDDTKLADFMMEKWGVLTRANVKGLAGKVLLIGHMGYSATPANILVTLIAIGEGLEYLKYPARLRSGIESALKEFGF